MSDNLIKTKFLMYKSRPLVKCGNIIFYGSMQNDHVVRIMIKDKKEIDGLQISTDLLVQYISTKEKDLVKSIEKVSKKEDLYSAIDIADIWLTRDEKAKNKQVKGEK